MVEKDQNILEQIRAKKKRFEQEELLLLKSTFEDRDDLLFAIRKVFLQMDISEQEDVMLRGILKDNVKKLLKKIIIPDLDGNAPITQIASLWLHYMPKLQAMDNEKAYIYLDAMEIVEKYLVQQTKVLFGEDVKINIKHKDLEYMDAIADEGRRTKYVNRIAWHDIITAVEARLMDIPILIGQVEKTAEEIEKIRKQNSSK